MDILLHYTPLYANNFGCTLINHKYKEFVVAFPGIRSFFTRDTATEAVRVAVRKLSDQRKRDAFCLRSAPDLPLLDERYHHSFIDWVFRPRQKPH